MFALAGVSGEAFCVESADTAAGAALARTRVDVSCIAGRPAPLAEVFSLIEQQTGLKFAYAVGRLPLGSEIVVKSAGTMPLSQLLADISAQHDVMFQLREGRLTAWSRSDSPGREPVSSLADRATVVEQSVLTPTAPNPTDHAPIPRREGPRPGPAAAATAAMALAAEVNEIADDATISGAIKEKRISLAVRTSVTVATADLKAPADILVTVQELAEAAASAVPRFVETIANAASFTPAVSRIARGQAKVRAAAYAGSRNPKS